MQTVYQVLLPPTKENLGSRLSPTFLSKIHCTEDKLDFQLCHAGGHLEGGQGKGVLIKHFTSSCPVKLSILKHNFVYIYIASSCSKFCAYFEATLMDGMEYIPLPCNNYFPLLKLYPSTGHSLAFQECNLWYCFPSHISSSCLPRTLIAYCFHHRVTGTRIPFVKFFVTDFHKAIVKFGIHE